MMTKKQNNSHQIITYAIEMQTRNWGFSILTYATNNRRDIDLQLMTTL